MDRGSEKEVGDPERWVAFIIGEKWEDGRFLKPSAPKARTCQHSRNEISWFAPCGVVLICVISKLNLFLHTADVLIKLTALRTDILSSWQVSVKRSTNTWNCTASLWLKFFRVVTSACLFAYCLVLCLFLSLMSPLWQILLILPGLTLSGSRCPWFDLGHYY